MIFPGLSNPANRNLKRRGVSDETPRQETLSTSRPRRNRADAVYPVTVLLRRLGIARNSLASLRRRGLPVHSIGRRCSLVYGWELLDLLRSESDQGSNDALDDAGNDGDSVATVPAAVPGGPEQCRLKTDIAATNNGQVVDGGPEQTTDSPDDPTEDTARAANRAANQAGKRTDE